MKKFPFTQSGTNSVLEALYQLGDEDLHKEVLSIQHDFIYWVAEHFELNEQQYEYLKQLPQNLLYTFCCQICLAMYHRLPIILNVISTETASPKPHQQINIIGITETKYTNLVKTRGSLTITVNC